MLGVTLVGDAFDLSEDLPEAADLVSKFLFLSGEDDFEGSTVLDLSGLCYSVKIGKLGLSILTLYLSLLC